MTKSRILFLNKDASALFITLFFSIVLLLAHNSNQVQHIKFQLSKIVNVLVSPLKWYDGIFSVREENKVLKQQLVQLSLLNSQLENYHQENIRLKEMLNFSKKQPLNFLVANIIGYNFGLPVQSVMIDIGEENGILNNLTVMDEKGLIGKTIEVGDYSSMVQLITDKNFRVSVRVGSDRALGLFIPTHGKYGVLDGVRKSIQLSKGEIAYTSGISDIYPPHIPIAKIVSIIQDDNSPFQNIVVELLATLEKLDYVFIVL